LIDERNQTIKMKQMKQGQNGRGAGSVNKQSPGAGQGAGDETFPGGIPDANRPVDDDGTFKLSRAKSSATLTSKKKKKCCK